MDSAPEDGDCAEDGARAQARQRTAAETRRITAFSVTADGETARAEGQAGGREKQASISSSVRPRVSGSRKSAMQRYSTEQADQKKNIVE